MTSKIFTRFQIFKQIFEESIFKREFVRNKFKFESVLRNEICWCFTKSINWCLKKDCKSKIDSNVYI